MYIEINVNGVALCTNYGALRDSATSAAIRAATNEEKESSDASEARGEHGHIDIDGRRCYVD